MINIKNYSVISDSEPIIAQPGINKPFRIFQRVFPISNERFADSLFCNLIELLNIFSSPTGINKLIAQLPNTSECVLVLPVL